MRKADANSAHLNTYNNKRLQFTERGQVLVSVPDECLLISARCIWAPQEIALYSGLYRLCLPVQKLDVSPAYLRNDGNKYLNYTDDWYILAQKPDEYAVIYYRGNNDAWKGYGGATVYTRCAPGSALGIQKGHGNPGMQAVCSE